MTPFNFRQILHLSAYTFIFFSLLGCINLDSGQAKTRDTKSRVDWKNALELINTGKANVLLCEGEERNMLSYIRHYADSVSALNLKYNQATANDCSGTFIRLNQYLASTCENTNAFLSFDNGRSTRNLIKYYYDMDRLIFIDEPLESDTLIRPGTVMFYNRGGRGGKRKFTAQNMENEVNHVGIVTSVEKDPETGMVLSYKLFHGRNPKRGINITDYHKREPYGKSLKPYPYGNGNQQWMAVAPVVDNTK